jgi:tetratricopeptide (TPR) repeat protein
MTVITDPSADASRRAAAIFAAIDDYEEATFITEIDVLAAELPPEDPDGLFHRASAQDSWGHPDLAIPLYRKALDHGGPTGENRRRAVIQLASSMRNTGHAEAALSLLLTERGNASDHLDDALACVTALCLASLDRDREGLSMVILALAGHLPRYNRSMAAYAEALLD